MINVDTNTSVSNVSNAPLFNSKCIVYKKEDIVDKKKYVENATSLT